MTEPPSTQAAPEEEIEKLRAEVARLRRERGQGPSGDKAVEGEDQRFKRLAQLLPEALFEVNLQGEIVFSNPKGLELFGYVQADLGRGLRAIDLVAPPDRGRAMENYRALMQGRYVGLQEYTLLRKDGTTFPAVVHTAALFHRGELQGQLGIIVDISQRKAAEQALKTSEHSYRTLAESLPGLVYRVMARDGWETRFLNQNLEVLTGYSDEELRRGDVCSIDPLIVPEDKPPVVAAVRRAIETRQSFEVEYRITNKQGQIRHFSERGRPIYDKDARLVYLDGVIFDVTARKQAEMDLRASEEKYRLLVENQTDLIVKLDAEGRLVFVSPSFCRMFGKSRAEAPQTEMLHLVHEEDRSAVRRDLRRLFQPPYCAHLEHRALAKGGPRWLAWMVTAVVDDEGNAKEFLGVGRDITDRKQAEMTLAHSESTLRAILQSSPVGIGLTQNRRLVWSNEAMPRMLGYFAGEMIGRDVRMFYADQAEYQRAWLELAHSLSSNPVGSTEARLRRKDGGLIHAQISLRPMDHADPEKGIIVALMDVTERNLSREALQKAHDQLEERVVQRTRELEEAIRSLRREIIFRQQMEESIRESQQRYHQLFTEMSAGFALHDIILDQAGKPVDYRFVQVNPAFERLTGLKADQILGKTVMEILPKTEPVWIEQYGKVALGGGSVHLERYSRGLDTFFEVSAFSPKRGQFATTFTDVSQRKRVERVLRQNEQYLNDLLDTMQTGVAIIDAQTHAITYVNTCAARMIGAPKNDIVGKTCHQFICPALAGHCPAEDPAQSVENSERILLTADGRDVPILKSVSAIGKQDKSYFVESFIDVSDMKRLLREQELSIARAKSILAFTNGIVPRHSDLGPDLDLAAGVIALPCHQEGGDHLFVRVRPSMGNGQPGKTIFSVKDQSGHKVGCILRSISTDLFHQAILTLHPTASLEETTALLNRKIGEHEILGGRHFVTAINGEIDHRTLTLRYLLCGHPNFLLIRGREVMLLPGPGMPGKNLPLGVLREAAFQAGEFRLQPEDQLIVFTDGLLDALSPQAPPHGGGGRSGEPVCNIVASLVRGREALPVMDIMEEILAMAARISGKPIHAAGVNGSDDDITILGLEIMSKASRRELTLQAGDVVQLQKRIDDLMDFFTDQWTKGGYGDSLRLRYALSEAVINAWKHGNRGDPEKEIKVRYRFAGDFYLEISDQGPGFDHQSINDPRYGRELMKSSGRGLLLINRHATSVAFNEQGNAVRMTFDRRPDSGHFLLGLDVDRYAFGRSLD